MELKIQGNRSIIKKDEPGGNTRKITEVTCTEEVTGSNPVSSTTFSSGRSSAWFRALAWGARGRRFKSARSDHRSSWMKWVSVVGAGGGLPEKPKDLPGFFLFMFRFRKRESLPWSGTIFWHSNAGFWRGR